MCYSVSWFQSECINSGVCVCVCFQDFSKSAFNQGYKILNWESSDKGMRTSLQTLSYKCLLNKLLSYNWFAQKSHFLYTSRAKVDERISGYGLEDKIQTIHPRWEAKFTLKIHSVCLEMTLTKNTPESLLKWELFLRRALSSLRSLARNRI